MDHENLQYEQGKITYTVKKDLFEQGDFTTVFLFDEKFDDADSNQSVYIRTEQIDFGKIPSKSELLDGYKNTTNEATLSNNKSTSSWAEREINELYQSSILNDSSFSLYKESITRERFIDIMVPLYEFLKNEKVMIDPEVSFKDSTNPNVLKAASIGITYGIAENMFGPDIALNREQMATILVRTLVKSGLTIDGEVSPHVFADDITISSWAKESIAVAYNLGMISGVGENKFAPGTLASNEQALVLVSRYLKNNEHIKWFSELDNDRIYLNLDDELYKIELNDAVLVNSNMTSSELMISSLDDLKTLVNISAVTKQSISYLEDSNPNVKGTALEQEAEHMKLTGSALFSGVDKIGEVMNVAISHNSFDKTFNTTITQLTNGTTTYGEAFDKVNYYDLDAKSMSGTMVNFTEIMSTLGIDVVIRYNEQWKIYEIEFK
ncbi:MULTISPECIES: S-layer homology domain-containing protein [unclassified Fusibacter]|uniref:S-layer homology domain-containing protein n=1 Tax=unclassified Fusibacter TaxID=2624464 RepID=UPI00149536F1|nr:MULTISPECIES: S-layer homology domain-containing protein [unclassified Fusibacter]MCK8060423.1 S-layer homology domain-containing protein [Fusibacter sp. A2]NPE20288.1 hypothetical protein [Fusibacter sp. A1]